MSSLAGPSRSSGHINGHAETQTQHGSEDRPASGKKRRISGVDDIFARQDAGEKAQLGRQYRELQAEAEEMRANQANITLLDLQKSFAAQDKVFHQVRDTGTAGLDSRLLSTNADTALGLVRKMRQDGNAFDIDEFVARIKARLGLNRLDLDDEDGLSEDELEESLENPRRRGQRAGPVGDWDKIGWQAARLTRRVFGAEFLYGPLTVTHTKRTVNRRGARAPLEPVTRPVEIDQTQQSAAQEGKDTATLVRKVYKVLCDRVREGEAINYFEFIINPNSYGQTVENVFYTSFLIKDGFAGIRVQEDGLVELVRMSMDEKDGEAGLPRFQAVIELDQEAFEEAKRIFNIRKSIIPDRPRTEEAPNMRQDQWYS